jgi:hypothetical protein
MSNRSLRSYSAPKSEVAEPCAPDEPEDNHASGYSSEEKEQDEGDNVATTRETPVQHTFGSFKAGHGIGSKERMMQFSMRKQGFLRPPEGFSRTNSAATLATPIIPLDAEIDRESLFPAQTKASSPPQAEPPQLSNDAPAQSKPELVFAIYSNNNPREATFASAWMTRFIAVWLVAMPFTLSMLLATLVLGLFFNYSATVMYSLWVARGFLVTTAVSAWPMAIALVGLASCVLVPYLVIKIGGFERVKK